MTNAQDRHLPWRGVVGVLTGGFAVGTVGGPVTQPRRGPLSDLRDQLR